MKKHTLTTLTVAIMIASTLFINIGNATNQTTYTIQSTGVINQQVTTPLTVILRNFLIFSDSISAINERVDTFVASHPHVTAITIMDMHQYGIWWYGYSFSNTTGTWMGANFNQIKATIDRFHYHGWQVGLETTGVAWTGQEEYNYITKQHPELSFTDGNGLRATGIDDITDSTKNPGYHNVIPNFFAKFETNDVKNNITVGTRLIDLYTNRLKQMIEDGLEFDFWFGTDGWNGFNKQGYFWNSQTESECYSFGVLQESEFGNWTGAILPKNWNNMNQIQRAQAIISNQTILNNWWYYWQIRFAEMYAQIRQVFIDTERPGPFYTIGTVDESSLPASNGNLSPAGMYNISLLTQYNAFDFFYNDQEGVQKAGATYALGRESAYSAAITKMQAPDAKVIIGLQLQNVVTYPLWMVKQQYLSQAINYVWYNGERYLVSDPSIIMIQYPTLTGYEGWNEEDVKELFTWIKAQSEILKASTPIWLGPAYILASTFSGAEGNGWCGLNFSFAQWAWADNLRKNPNFINSEMKTLFLDASLKDTNSQLVGCSSSVLDKWSNNYLNIWYWEVRGWRICSTIFGEDFDTNFESAFKLTYNLGTITDRYSIVNSTSDPAATWIISGHEGLNCNYNAGYQPSPYIPNNGFISIANTNETPSRLGAGIYQTQSSGRFVFTHYGSNQQNSGITLPRDLLNKLLYWVTDCPINSSEPLIDLKILKSGNSLILPMTNQKDVGDTFGSMKGLSIDTTLKIDSDKLGLGHPIEYQIFWASNKENITFTTWDNIQIDLKGMADTLIIQPK